jgi:hypothetical protein
LILLNMASVFFLRGQQKQSPDKKIKYRYDQQ